MVGVSMVGVSIVGVPMVCVSMITVSVVHVSMSWGGAEPFTFRVGGLCLEKAVLKGPRATYHLTLSFCHSNEGAVREAKWLCSQGGYTEHPHPRCLGRQRGRGRKP